MSQPVFGMMTIRSVLDETTGNRMPEVQEAPDNIWVSRELLSQSWDWWHFDGDHLIIHALNGTFAYERFTVEPSHPDFYMTWDGCVPMHRLENN